MAMNTKWALRAMQPLPFLDSHTLSAVLTDQGGERDVKGRREGATTLTLGYLD